MAMVTFAGQAGKECLSAVAPECEGIEGKLSEWGTDVAKARALYSAIFSAMDTHGDRYTIYGIWLRVYGLGFRV